MSERISDEAIEAAAQFWEFLGQHGTAKDIRARKGFRTTAEVFESFKKEVTSDLLDRIADLENALYIIETTTLDRDVVEIAQKVLRTDWNTA